MADLPEVCAAAAALGVTLTDEQVTALARFRDLLLDWNTRVNLTAIRDPAGFERLHLVDAVGLLRAINQDDLARARLVDIGSGGGLPGIPLAIIAPGLHVTLIEATGKKVAFQQAAIEALGLRNVEAVHGRAETLAHDPELRERFDLATARAVAELPALVELCLPFLRVGGRLLAQKKIGIEEEIRAAARALRTMGGGATNETPLDLPGLEDRQIVLIRKVQSTPADYPRRPGLPRRSPLV